MQVVDDGGLVQMGQFGHIVCLVELGRVDLVDALGIDLALLPPC